MADFTALKTAIETYIKQNGNEEITGEVLQTILLSIVTTLGDSAINDLVTALNAEVAARQNADSSLEGAINQEGTLRSNADSTLQGNINAEATARENADTALSNRLGSTITAENTAADQIGAEAEAREAADTALQGLIDGITNNIENGYVYAGIATPSSTPVTGKVFYLALTAGTYTHFGNTVVTQGINILKYNGSAWSLDAFIGIDDELAPGSNNLPKSGNVLENIIKNGSAFDLSAYNAVDGVLATYADLDAALAALNALPAVYKQGGMSMRYVQSSDNKYVQARLMADSFTTDVTQWQGVDEEPIAGSDNLVKSGGVMQTLGIVIDNSYSFTGNGNTYDYKLIGSYPINGYESIMVIWGDYDTPEGSQENPFIRLIQKDSNNQNVATKSVTEKYERVAINENAVNIEIYAALSTTTASVSGGTYTFDRISVYGTIKYDVETLKLKNKYVTPEEYGAVCDGVTDDTDAFQAAIDSGKPVYAFGSSYKVTSITLRYGNTLYITNNITGTILLKGSRINLSLNRLHGRIVVGDTEGATSHNIIKFNLIYTPNGQDGITLDGSACGVQNTLIYGGQITNYTATSEKLYRYGIHMISGNNIVEGHTSFCNQNIILAVVAYNALNAGLFMDATATDNNKPAKMDGNMFFNFDPEASTKGVIMGTYCIGNCFYGLRNNEFGVSDTLLEFGEGCENNTIHLAKGFFPENIKYTGNVITPFNILHGGMLNLSFGSIWNLPTLFRGELDGKVALVPQGNLPDKLINLSEDTLINYNTHSSDTIANGTIFEGEHTLILNNSFGPNKRTSLKVLAYEGDIPTDILVPKNNRSIVDLNINKKTYSFESHASTYDYISLETVDLPANVGNIYVESGEFEHPQGAQLPLYLRLLDNHGTQIASHLIIPNNTLIVGISSYVYAIQLQARLSTSSVSVAGTYVANNITVKGNVSAHIIPSATAVEENTLYDIQLSQANYYVSKRPVNIGVLK